MSAARAGRCLILAAALLGVRCGPKTPPASPAKGQELAVQSPLNADAVKGVTDPTLARLLSDAWEASLRRWPENATRLGEHRFDALLGDRSPAAYAADLGVLDGFLARARAIPTAGLSASDAVTLALFIEDQGGARGEAGCQTQQWSVSTQDNPLAALNELGESLALPTAADGDHLLARYGAFPATVNQTIEDLKLGLARGATANAESVRRTLQMVAAVLGQPTSAWTLVVQAREAHDGWTPEEQAAFEAAVAAEIDGALRPSLRSYADFVRAEILPKARADDTPGLSGTPAGKDCYNALIRRHTTLPLSAEEIHATGLAELDSVHAEMRALGKKLFGTEDLAAIFQRLRTDPTLYFQTSDEVEAKAAAALAAAQAAVPRTFGRLPKAGCGIARVPDYQAPFTTIAYYMPAVPGETDGHYYINTYAPTTRPRYEAEVLAFHESVPGHHLQIALAQELGELPAFRRYGMFTAFVEGWALYTERLADEMGLYSGDLDRMGMLSFDSWRASRLVVDTGLHAMGWSRKQAEDFLRTNTPLAENNIVNEVDRYIGWPGQALAYKTGQQEILRLREEAQQKLGPKFSLPGFHDAVLTQGAVSLPVLRAQVEAWEARVAAGS